MNTKDAMTTRRTWGVFLAFLAFSAMALPAAAQTSQWAKMSLVGDWWTWNPNPSNLRLISNSVWEGTFFIKSMASNRYKFVANEAWQNGSWGESNQTSFVAPIFGDAEQVWGDGHDILQTNIASGYYRFRFDDSNLTYSIELVQPMEANYGSMAAPGSYNSWDTTPNMTLISNNTWQTEVYVNPAKGNQFKFTAYNWSVQWGDLNQSVWVSPVIGTAELVSGGRDIYVNGLSNGIYRITFNDSTFWYKIEFVRAGVAAYPSMAVASSWNGWNTFPNMTLITDHVWEATFSFENSSTLFFKFAPNGNWNTSWGDTNQTLIDIPLMGLGETVSGNGSDIYLDGPLSGRYYFRFNDTNFYYEVVPEGIMQTYNTWSRKAFYGNYTNDGWVIYDGRVDTNRARYGMAVILHDESATTGFGQYVQTPYLTNSLLNFGFWYRKWDASPDVSFEIQKSYDGSSWTTIGTVTNFDSTIYSQYATNNLNETNGLYIRVIHTGGKDQVLIDDFYILEAIAKVTLSGVTLSPLHPWSNDAVNVSAMVVPNPIATGVVARTYYRAGTNGEYTAITMTGITNWLSTTTAIPAKPSGTVVYYYVGVTFGGRGNNSPIFWPEGGSNDPAWYGVPRTKHGAVWINEINAEDPYFADAITNEFVELCGRAQSDIGGWIVELYGSVNDLYASYHIQNNTILPNDYQGFGFFVLGLSNIPNVNMVFSHAPEGSPPYASYLKTDGGVRLLNEFGVVQYAMSYGLAGSNLYGFSWIGIDTPDLWADFSLALTGTGSNYYNFTWATNDASSPGDVNALQFMTGGNLDPLPSLSNVWFTNCRAQTQVTMRATSTNGWVSAPFYTTRITNHWSQWIAISPYYSSYANGITTVWFDYPSGVTNAYFRLITTRSW